MTVRAFDDPVRHERHAQLGAVTAARLDAALANRNVDLDALSGSRGGRREFHRGSRSGSMGTLSI